MIYDISTLLEDLRKLIVTLSEMIVFSGSQHYI